MEEPKYTVNQLSVSTLLSWIRSGDVAIPEIQRPFVWDSKKVRNFIDSLYKEYPVGYIIIWKNPDTRLKNGHIAEGKKIIIDGQQRLTALQAAILGTEIVNKSYQSVRIKISFNPVTEEFSTQTPAIVKDSSWIADISEVLSNGGGLISYVRDFNERNKNLDARLVEQNIERLLQIMNRPVGVIELDQKLDIETVTEIFVRINGEGVVLGQADFVMSKIAANTTYGGIELRKCIDYFSHLAEQPSFIKTLSQNDTDFAKGPFFSEISWLANENLDLYIPDYKDILRVAAMTHIKRGKLSDVVSLLSGRNFKSREYEEAIAKESFALLRKGVVSFVNRTHFTRFIMILKSAGIIQREMIRAQNVANFAYSLYLLLRQEKYPPEHIERYVRKWFILSSLTQRYSVSFESSFDRDLRMIKKGNFEKFLQDTEDGQLSDAYWKTTLPQALATSVLSSPYFEIYLAAQVKAKDNGFLSRDISIHDLLTHRGDVHHIFPKDYLVKNGLPRNQYNQIANYVVMQTEINIAIGNKSPQKYFEELRTQVSTGKTKYGGITSEQELLANLEQNCIPTDTLTMTVKDYPEFLELRRKLIAEKIKQYYQSL